ncbi:MAG: NAD(P)H-dependent oxidoreductase subunit E [Thermoleophilaceae bacterium]
MADARSAHVPAGLGRGQRPRQGPRAGARPGRGRRSRGAAGRDRSPPWRAIPTRTRPTLPALASAQKVHGWCSPLALHQTAAVMQVTPAYLSSVATFYDMLRTEPIGDRYLFVCTSVACHLRDAKAVYEAIAEEARDQGLEGVDLREFECLGACDMAPMASIDGRYVGPLDAERRARADAPP